MQSVTERLVAELTGCTEQHLFRRQDGFLVHPQLQDAFETMCQAAQQEGITIKIVSAFRSFERQALIWQNKLSGKRPVFDIHGGTVDIETLTGAAKLAAVLLYSALPGASRHHWGTDLDIYDAAAIDESYQVQLSTEEYSANGPFARLVAWLDEHAHRYGFFMPYQAYQGGVAAEPWHISYQPLSSQYLAKINVQIIRQCLLKHPVAEQTLVLDNLQWIVQQFVQNICPTKVVSQNR